MPKDAIYSKVKVEAPGPGYCHFPDAYQREYFDQLTSEEDCDCYDIKPTRKTAEAFFESGLKTAISVPKNLVSHVLED